MCILTSERTLAHAFAWSKTMENIQKSWKKYLFHLAYERLVKKNKTKFQMSSQLLGVNQLLGVTPNCWPTNFFLRFSSWASRTSDGKVTFSWFLNVFHPFRPCECMRKHAFAGPNTHHIITVITQTLRQLIYREHNNP